MALAALLALLAFPTTAFSSEGQPPFCSQHIVHDYLKPLEKLPALRKPPTGEHLPFSPQAVELLSGDPLQVGAGEIGFSLVYGKVTRRLDWLVTASLTKVGANGRDFAEPETKQVHVGRPSNYGYDDFYFPVSAKPALYRVEIAFRNRSGKRLGHFGKYFRTVPLHRDVRLDLNAASYAAQETVYGRIGNYGTIAVLYGAPYVIEKYAGSAWSRAPESPRAFIRPLYRTDPGLTGRCTSFQIPSGMPPGLYRMSKHVKGNGKANTLTAEFEVQPAP